MAEGQEKQQRKEEPIIIKKKKGHGGHGAHGGAWKVAYADFVTAMMAFFIVMWIMGQSEEIKKKVVNYFNDPGAFSFIDGKRSIPIDLQLKNTREGAGEAKKKEEKSGLAVWLSDEVQDSIVSKIKNQAIQDSVKAADRVAKVAEDFKKFLNNELISKPELRDILSSIKIEMTKEGLRIELIETSESMFFEVGSAAVKEKAKEILIQLAQQIGKLPNYVDIEGHTDSRQYRSKAIYSNWELSSDRANSARRILESKGFWEGQISKVTGYADRKLRKPDNPFDNENRRISILVRQLSAKDFLPEEVKVGKMDE